MENGRERERREGNRERRREEEGEREREMDREKERKIYLMGHSKKSATATFWARMKPGVLSASHI